MPFRTDNLQTAYLAYKQFNDHNPPAHHERYIFPFFAGSYFTYRKVDVMRVIAIANSISPDPNYIDIGCGYGDFLSKIRKFIPDAIGLEEDPSIFYIFQKHKPDYIFSEAAAAEWFGKRSFDVSFVGWMEPGVDFRKTVSQFTKCIITTFDAGGQCGINGGCEYDEFGFQKIAWWRTPSWIDVNCELMNRFYTSSLRAKKSKKEELTKLRTAHNLWYVYTRPEISHKVRVALKRWLKKEEREGLYAKHRFDFESVLDECGFHYMEPLAALLSKGNQLWEVRFD
jgi:SAM-dependent methyltransferase